MANNSCSIIIGAKQFSKFKGKVKKNYVRKVLTLIIYEAIVLSILLVNKLEKVILYEQYYDIP